MLQSPIIIQIIIAVISLGSFFWGLKFKYKANNKSDKKEKYKILGIVLLVLTALGTIYFFYNLITTTPFTGGKMAIACIKAIIFISIGVEILCYMRSEDMSGISTHVLLVVLVSLSMIVIVPLSGLINYGVYESKVIEQQKQKYQQDEFVLVAIFNDQEIEDAINSVKSTNAYYNTIIEEGNADTTELASKGVYEVCYIENEEMVYDKLDMEKTVIIPLENGKKPYLLVKKYTKYSIDYNYDPPIECDFEDTYEYELHVPEK